MGTTLSTLTNLAIYIALVILGAFLGSRKALRSRPLVWVGKLQFVALMILIVTLGVNLGANDEVVSSLGQIGLSALVITVLAMAGSILALTLLRRFVLKLDRYGLPQGSEAAVEEYTARFGSVPDMDVSVSPSGAMDMSALMSSNSKDVVLLGSDLDTLQTAAEQVEEAMTQVPGVIRIENPFRSSQSKGRIVINSQKAMALGRSIICWRA